MHKGTCPGVGEGDGDGPGRVKVLCMTVCRASIAAQLPQNPNMKRGLVGVLAVVAMSTSGCTGERAMEAARACEEVERAAYPQLEKLVSETLANVDHTTERIGYCVERGVPGPGVVAELPGYGSRRAVFYLLVDDGWLGEPDVAGVRSADGAYVARIIKDAPVWWCGSLRPRRRVGTSATP